MSDRNSRLTAIGTGTPAAAGRRGDTTRFSRLVQSLLQVVERWDIAWVLVAFNFAGFVAGIVFWYWDQLFNRAAGQWYLWPFIPDCPLFAGLFIVAFLGLRKGRDWRLFYTITAYGLVKYGVWTVVFSVAYWLGGAPVEPMSLIMCLSHLGMILEGLYVSYRIIQPLGSDLDDGGRGLVPSSAGFRWSDVLVAFGWFLLSDFVDYGLGHYPEFDPSLAPMALIQWHTVFMTGALAAVCFVLSKRRRVYGQI